MPKPSTTTLRCAAWNVNGIRAVERKNLLPWDVLGDHDVLCLQEVKARPDQLRPSTAEPEGWYSHWNPAQRPGYSGVAIMSREQPDEVHLGMGQEELDCEGRVLSVRFGELVIISAYFPNAQEAGERFAYKLAFCKQMERFLASWHKQGYQTLLMGDYNIAHRPIDLARPDDNQGNPGYLPEERDWFGRYLELGYRDVFRERNPELAEAYTWWSYRTRARERNIGWRIDYGTVSPALIDRVSDAAIHPEIMGSDHCPVSVALG